jgi:HK97 family phage portal protein
MFNRIREYFASKSDRKMAEQVAINLIDMWQANRPLAPLWDIKRFADDGYRRNSLVFACIRLRSVCFMDPELVAYQDTAEGKQELEPEHMLAMILGHPNARDSQSAFMQQWSIHLDVAGKAAALKLRNTSGMPVALQILRPDCIWAVPDSYGNIRAFQYGLIKSERSYTEQQFEEGIPAQGNEPALIPARDVIYDISNPDPLNPYDGLPPIAVLSRMGDLDNFAADYLRAFFLNAGIPSGILKFKIQTSKDERERARELWKDRFRLRSFGNTGTGGAFDVGVLDSDVDYEEIGSKLKTMDLSGVFGETESRICSTFGTPPILVAAYIGLVNGTYSNYETALKHFYRSAMKPLWISTSDRYTVDLASEFGSNLVCEFKIDDIPELQVDKQIDKDFALQAWDSGLATKNEAREACGWQPDSDGNVYKVSPQDTFEPAAIQSEAYKSRPVRERHSLPAPRETSAAQLEEWKQLQKIADKALPALKKKSLVQ